MASKSDAPDTPDYLGAALAQGQLSKESALSQTGLNRPNEVTPYGTRTWSRTNTVPPAGGTGNPNQQPQIPYPGSNTGSTTDPFGGRTMGGAGSGGSAAAGLTRGQRGQILEGAKNASNNTTSNPYADLLAQSNQSIIDPGDWTVTTELSPEQQAILDQSNEYKMLSGGMASNALTQFGNQGGINFTNPDLRKSDAKTTQLTKFNSGPVNVTPTAQKQFQGSAVNVSPTAMNRFEGSPVGLNDLGYTQDSFAQQRQSVEDAVFNRSKRMLDPTYSQQEQAMRSRLANQGLAEGSQAYQTEMENFNRDRSNAYQAAIDSAVLTGGQEQSRLVSDLLSTRNQDLQNQLSRYDTNLKTADFNNQASQTDFSNKLQSGLAGFSTGLQANQANNQTLQANFDNKLQSALTRFGTGLQTNQANNQTAQNEFQQGLAANQANSQYDLQLMQALLGARGQALNEAQALNSGTAVTQPQFGGYAGAGAGTPADIMGALNSTFGANMGAVNAQNANAAATNQGLASMASLLLLASDRRLKSNIQPIGTGYKGLTVYSYDIFGKRDTGYMAQEVQEVAPEAVLENPAGFLMVNYSMLGGKP